MSEFLHRIFVVGDNFYVWSLFTTLPHLMASSSFIFWLFFIIFVRFQLPILVLYIGYFTGRRWFEPPPYKLYAEYKPLISFLIAARNPGPSVASCIESILNNNYKNVEVIYADDKSTDNSIDIARQFERTGRVRVIANANHSGKPANLNLGLMFARGEFVFILDADSVILPDTVDNMLPYFEDPTVGAVSPTIFARNPNDSFLTRCQQLEYVMSYGIGQIWRDRVGLIAILSGMGTFFRMAALRHIGGWDMGLGDDTDSTIRLRKAHWKLRTSLRGHLRTEVPVTLGHLLKQRSRWTRNLIKARVRKHRDLGTFRFGFMNALMFYDIMITRVIHPYLYIGLPILFFLILKTSDIPVFFVSLYVYSTFFFTLDLLIARDMTRRAPAIYNFLVIPVYFLYRIPLLYIRLLQMTRELLMIKTWHPYVPRRIWNSIRYH